MTLTTVLTDADQALKAKHRAMWALGDYPDVAANVVGSLGGVLVDSAGVRPGDRVLDVAAGTGSAAIPAALAGASVVASDLTPELVQTGQRLARERGAAVDWRVADAEDLPFSDGYFDVVISCIGVMFAPHHQTSADELVRVCRPGGTIGLLSWTPAGFIGQMFATMKPYAPPPPPGAEPPPLWGDEQHVRDLLGDRVGDVTACRAALLVDRFATPEAFRHYFKQRYGPTIGVYRAIAEEPERVAALDAALDGLARRFDAGGGVMPWEYLVVTARKHG